MLQVSTVGPQFPHLSWLSRAAGKPEGLTILEEDGLRLGRRGQEAVHVPAPRLESSRQQRSWKPLVSPPALRTVKQKGPAPTLLPPTPPALFPTPALWAVHPLPAWPRLVTPGGYSQPPHSPTARPQLREKGGPATQEAPIAGEEMFTMLPAFRDGHAPPPQSSPPQAWCFLEV